MKPLAIALAIVFPRVFDALFPPTLDVLFPRFLGAQLTYIARANAIESAARRHGVPVDVLGSVGWLETRLGVWKPYASLLGVRVNHRYVRDDAQSADIGARSLARLFVACGTWPRAFARYRTGGACGNPEGMPYARGVDGTAARLRISMTRGGSL